MLDFNSSFPTFFLFFDFQNLFFNFQNKKTFLKNTKTI